MSKNNRLDNLDILLYTAFESVGTRELEVYNSVDPAIDMSPRTTMRIKKRLEREVKYHDRHKTYSPAIENMKRAAVVALIVIAFTFTCVISVEAVRVTLWETIVEWYENSIFFQYIYNENMYYPDEILEYKEPVLGDEFERYVIEKDRYGFSVEFESENILIVYDQDLIKNYNVKMSNNDSEMREITVNGYEGIMTTYIQKHGVRQSNIVWSDGEYVYRLSGNVTYDKLIEMAGTIQ